VVRNKKVDSSFYRNNSSLNFSFGVDQSSVFLGLSFKSF